MARNTVNKELIKGRNMMLFKPNGESYAYCISNRLVITTTTSNISTKDHGQWNALSADKYNWTVSSEYLTTDNFDTLFNAMITNELVLVKFGEKIEDDPNKTVSEGDYQAWHLNGQKTYYQGYAVITNIEQTATNSEIAQFTIEMQGVGKLIAKDDFVTMSVDEEGYDYGEDKYMNSADVYLPEPLNKLSFMGHIEADETETPRFTNKWVNEGGTQVVDFNVIGSSFPCGVAMIHFENDNVRIKKVNFELYAKQRETPYQASNPTITIKAYRDGTDYPTTTYDLSVSASTGESEHLQVEVPVPTDAQGNLVILISHQNEQDHLCIKGIDLKYIENN